MPFVGIRPREQDDQYGRHRPVKTIGMLHMKRSTDRILTSHVGSLIRPGAVAGFFARKQKGQSIDDKCVQNC